MKNRKSTVLTPVRRVVVSPAEFKAIVAGGGALIERSRFVPPTPGKPGFGSFELQYALPVLRPVKEAA